MSEIQTSEFDTDLSNQLDYYRELLNDNWHEINKYSNNPLNISLLTQKQTQISNIIEEIKLQM